MIEVLKAPPHSVESEQNVIGGLLLDPRAIDRIDWLADSAFYSSANRTIYRAQRKILEAGRALDFFLLCEELGADLEGVGGQAYVGSICVNTASAANIHLYAAIVRDKALLRNMMTLGMEIQERASAIDAKPAELAAELEGRINDVAQGREESEAVEFHKSMDAAYLARQSENAGLYCGYPDIDKYIKPMHGGDLIIMAGRPSMGKSALATCIAEHVAHEHPVGFWSLEMGRASIAERIVGWHERDGRDASKLATLQLYIDTPYSLTIGSLRLRMKRLRRKHGLSLAVVDYLQLMRGDGENRTQEIGSISRGLKQLAVEMDIPVIAVCQLNRGVEQRTDKRPLLSDLRESGDIEQDADIAMMVYRDEYYDANSPAAGTAEVIVRKHRNGRIGTARLTFIPDHARFLSYAGPEIRYPDPVRPLRAGRLHAVDHKTRAAGDD